MTDRKPALRASEVRRWVPAIALAASMVGLFVVGTATAHAKQSCSVAAGAQGYWSWRMIDGRKCWYEGKPMLSKAALEWPAQAAAQAAAKEELAAGPPAEKHGNPLDAQAYEPAESPTFEALWHDRIEKPQP